MAFQASCAGGPSAGRAERPECVFEFKTAEFTWPPGFSLPPSSSHRMALVTSAARSEPVSPAQCAQLSLLTVWLSVLVWTNCMWRDLLASMVLSVLKEEGPHLESGWLRHRKCGNTGKVGGN